MNRCAEWNDQTVRYFEIVVERERDFRMFFRVEPPPEDFSAEVDEFLGLDLSDVMLQSTINVRSIKHRLVKLLVKHIIAVTKTHRHEESAVGDMSTTLLELFEYDGEDCSIRSRSVLGLFMCNEQTQAVPDVLVERLDDTAVKLLLLVQQQEDDRNLEHPESQLIAVSIAAYQENMHSYERLDKDDFPGQQVIPGITMIGTCPTFYLITVTRDLADCVRTGDKPAFTTTVKKYVIPNLPVNICDTILSKPHRYHIAQCLEAFKGFV